jgi:protease-4
MSKEAVEAVAKGQVWSGAAAKQNGLVDQLGGLMTAVDLLRPLAKIAPDAQVSVEPYPNSTDKLQAAIARLMGGGGDAETSASLARLLRVAGPFLTTLDLATRPAADERLRAPLP